MSIRESFLEANPIESVLSEMGVNLIGEGDNRKAKCPFHDDNNPSFSVKISDGSWNCFAGCGKGGVVELIAKHKNTTPDAILKEFSGRKDDHPLEHSPVVDWNECVAGFGEAHQQRLSDWRGYSSRFSSQLVANKMIGLCDGNLSFPIIAGGKVIGTHQRFKSGGWVTRGGRGDPWVIGEHFDHVFVFESQWDAFAMMDALNWFDENWGSLCSIVITRGASKGKQIQNLFPTTGVITVWMQNDKLDEKGSSPAEKWLADIVSVLRKVKVCRPPKEFKDLNEWRKDGFATRTEVIELMESAQEYRDPSLPSIREPLSLDRMMAFDPKNDSECLLGNRYLCRGGSALWVGGSGIGKSVITIQAAITFSLGESLFGLNPKRSLKSIIVSAEDDFGDISETMQGVLLGMGIKQGTERYNTVKENVLIIPEAVLKGIPFVGWCEDLVREYKADLLWINPLLSYYSGNPSDPEKTSEFTGALSAMQFRTGVCSMLVHHTGKPKEAESQKQWSVDDFSYIGLGSSVWTNWARAIVVLQSMKAPKNTFVLRFAKRGQRAGITNDDFEKVREVYLEHAEKGLRWVTSDFCPNESENENQGRPAKVSWERVCEGWDGTDKTTPELKKIIRDFCPCTDKTAWRAIEKWCGVHITKNNKDLWVKISQ